MTRRDGCVVPFSLAATSALFVIYSLLETSVLAAASVPPTGLTFEKDIRPIIRAHCLDCHGSQNVRKGGLDLRLRRLIVKGGESGEAIVPGHPDQSYLLDRLKAGEMPPGEQKVPAKEMAIIAAWIAAGAPTAHAEPADLGAANLITDEDRDYWAFRPIHRPKVPTCGPADRVRTPVDAFLLDAMRRKGLSFASDADKRTLIRRLSLDLVGLPPTPSEVSVFLADTSPNAYERLVDRLLDSPHYGERWGRHWLDVAGYADSEGYDQDVARPEAYRFRDYVVRAFNANKPFDQFVIEQLAGDELVPQPLKNMSPQTIETLTATGFLRMAADGTASPGATLATASNQVMSDTIKIVSTSLLGLSVGCAQCHDHRYDPILQDDYYRLRAVFEPALNWKNWSASSQRRVSLYTDADRARAAALGAEASKVATAYAEKQNRYITRSLDKELAKLEPSLARQLKTAFETPEAKRTAEQKSLLGRHPNINISAGTLYQYDPAAADELKRDAAKIAAIQARVPAEQFLRVLSENPGEVPPTFLFYRGDFQQPKQEIAPGDLIVCVAEGQKGDIAKHDPRLPTSGRRLAYARRLMSGRHPLVGRVLANRVWLLHFGRGIVGTPSDFGHLGDRPTHPELLDWLADEFATTGWDLKRLQRLIVTSTAYRQNSARTPERDAADPDNLLLSRMNVRRLDAEIIRDSVLAASGSEFARMYGPPIPVKEDAVGQIIVGIDTKVGANEPGAEVPLGAEEFRRSLYIEVRRSRPLALLRAFDAPVMETNCDRRIASTAAPQALMMMNSDFTLTEANRFAQRLKRDAGPDPRREVSLAFELAFGRAPDAAEMDQSLAFLRLQTDELKARPGAAHPQKHARATRNFKKNRRPKYEAMLRSTAA
ncbi:MAG TPA: PSD1 and planctomycete cytochrome C domain-containing protein, partial [Planctomycetaceae bacterium]|nr:PSD1 and planctomycete cytochrome C domain-containing protein [Planctomycetaceae bacterium]